jgi:peptidoglycan/LPS O-acetylase OafA/YrhL
VIPDLNSNTNAIRIVRLALAFAVLWGHSFVLSGSHGPLEDWTAWHGMAVAGFFLLSGVLITRSFQGANLVPFIWHRILRIMPGYWACLLLTALVLGVAYPNEALSYLRADWFLMYRKENIGEWFAANLFPLTVNGSLWTLESEFKCYLGVAVLGVLGVFRWGKWLVPLLAIFLFVLYFLKLTGRFHDASNTTEQRLYFALGMTAFLYRDKLKLDVRLGIPLLLAGLALTKSFAILSPLCFSYGLLAVSYGFADRLPRKFPDLSYGVYLYAFPIQQLLSMWGAQRFGLGFYIASSVVCVIPLALFSWYVIEQPANRLKKRKVLTHAVVSVEVPELAPVK